MASGLNGRVRVLELQADRVAGRSSCHGGAIAGVDAQGQPPAWADIVNDQPRCRTCWAPLKLLPQDLLNTLL
jgi:hypothetical protein